MEDEDQIRLSRTTRELFLAELALKINVEKRRFTEAELTTFAEEMSNKFDYGISPSKFVYLFIDKHILHVENGIIRFTLPFIELYLLALRLRDQVDVAEEYFNTTKADFDYRTFTLYAELGPSPGIINAVSTSLDASIELFEAQPHQDNALLDQSIRPAILAKQDRIGAVQKRLQKAVDDVQADRGQSRAKQAILDASDRTRGEMGAEI